MRALALLLAVALPALAADPPKKPDPKEKIANWEYAHWSKFKAGTSVTTKSSINFGGKPTESGMIVTLKEVTDDKVVLETVSVTKGGDKGEPTKREVPKEVSAKGVPGVDAKTGLPDGVTEEGTEKLKVGGTEYECKWYKFKIKNAGIEVTGQTWVCDDVPGRQVKFFNKASNGGFNQEVTEVTVKK